MAGGSYRASRCPSCNGPVPRTAHTHRVWLPRAVRAMIGDGVTGFVFTDERGQPIKRVDAAMRDICAKLSIKNKATPHDLRRTHGSTITGLGFGRYAIHRPLRRNRIAGQFSARTIEMMEAPSWSVLSLAARLVLDRIEIEQAHHGGNDNGRLPVTFDQFVEFGVHRHSIGPALRELCALGYIEITERGRAGNGEWRRPNLFRANLSRGWQCSADPRMEAHQNRAGCKAHRP